MAVATVLDSSELYISIITESYIEQAPGLTTGVLTPGTRSYKISNISRIVHCEPTTQDLKMLIRIFSIKSEHLEIITG